LIDDSRNFEGFINRRLGFRSMFETTNTHVTPDNQRGAIATVIFKINYALFSFWDAFRGALAL